MTFINVFLSVFRFSQKLIVEIPSFFKSFSNLKTCTMIVKRAAKSNIEFINKLELHKWTDIKQQSGENS